MYKPVHATVGDDHIVRARDLQLVFGRHLAKDCLPQHGDPGGSGVVGLTIAQRLLHGLAGVRRDIERWVALLQPQDLSALRLLIQQAVAHLDDGAQ